MNKLLVTKDFNNKIKYGPSTSIINELKDNKNANEKIYILDHCFTNRQNLNDKNINYIIIKNFFDLTKKLKTILNIVKNSNQIEIHCIFDALLFFSLIIILKIFRKEFKIYLRGMVNKNVLKKKRLLKLVYLFIAKPFIKNATIVYTSKYEKKNSIKFFKNNKYIIINNKIDNKFIKIKNNKIYKKPNHLKILFFSNLIWKKNFDFVYRILKDLDFNIELNIYGKCCINSKYFSKMILDLKKKHKVTYNDYYSNKNKSKIFFSHHLFFLPTIDENFGHAIVENFLHYRPCLLSNNTPWNDNAFFNAGRSYSLNKTDSFRQTIKYFYLMNQKKYNSICKNSKNYILEKLKNKDF
jgi:hypothetical protein